MAKTTAPGILDTVADAAVEDASASAPHQVAARRMDLILAKQGMPRSERRALIQELKAGTPGATTSGKQNAAATTADLADPIAELQAALSRFSAAATQTGEKP